VTKRVRRMVTETAFGSDGRTILYDVGHVFADDEEVPHGVRVTDTMVDEDPPPPGYHPPAYPQGADPYDVDPPVEQYTGGAAGPPAEPEAKTTAAAAPARPPSAAPPAPARPAGKPAAGGGKRA